MSWLLLALAAPFVLAASRWRFSRLRRAGPHPFGLTGTPLPAPMMLSEEGWHGLTASSLSFIVLSYGHPLKVSEPLIEVATCWSEADCYPPSLEEAIGRAEHRDDAIARGYWAHGIGVFEPAPELPLPAGPFGHGEHAVMVGGEQRTLPVVSYRHYQALRFRQGPAVITAVARFGLPAVPCFETVDDLEPYFDGLTQFGLSLLRFWEA